jgi:hypothetical protein
VFLFADYNVIGAQAWLEANVGQDPSPLLQRDDMNLRIGVLSQAFNLDVCGAHPTFDILGIYFGTFKCLPANTLRINQWAVAEPRHCECR